MIANPNIQGALRDNANNDVWYLNGVGAPVNGSSGTAVGFAGPGSRYVNISNGDVYTNTGTKASPTWTSGIPAGTITEAQLAIPSLAGLGVVRYAKATYDFAVDGGAVSTITFAINAIIPINAIILGGIIDVITPFTTSASGTMSIGTLAGSSAASLKAALAAASYTGLVAVVPVFTAATMFKMSAAGAITGTIATGAITAGKANIIVAYVVGG